MATQPRPSLAAVPQTQRRSFLGKVAVTPAKLNPRRFFRRRRAEQDGGVPLAHLVVEVLEAKLSHRTGAPHDAFCHITYANSTVNSPTRSSSTTRSKALVWAKENAPGDARLEKVIYENNQFGGERVAEIILWGKGMTRKEYIGEISLEIQDFWPTIHSEQRQPASYRPPIAFNDPENKPVWHSLRSSRARSGSDISSGEILVKIGFLPPPSPASSSHASPSSSQTLANSSNHRAQLTSEQLDTLHTVLRRLVTEKEGARRASKEERILLALPTEGVGTKLIEDTSPIGIHPSDRSRGDSSDSSSDSGSLDDDETDGGDDLPPEELDLESGSSETDTGSEESDSDSIVEDPGYFEEYDRLVQEEERNAGHAADDSLDSTNSSSLPLPPSAAPLDQPLPSIILPPATPAKPLASPSLSVTSSRRGLSLPKFMKRSKSSLNKNGDTSSTGAGNSRPESDVTGSDFASDLGHGDVPLVAKEKKRRFRRRRKTTKDPLDSEKDAAANDEPTKKSRRHRFRPGRRTANVEGDAGESSSKSKRRFIPSNKRLARRKTKRDYNFSSSETSYGLVQIEIKNASNLPVVYNTLRTSFDCDPFVVTSFSTRVYRTRVQRHTRNPVWNEKLFFHVKEMEENYLVNFHLLDWDRATSNDHIGDVSLPLQELIGDSGPKKNDAGFYETTKEGKLVGNDFVEQRLKIVLDARDGKEVEGKDAPTLLIRTKFTPYEALRQQFWRVFLRIYDIDEDGSFSDLELQAALDSLGSTLSKSTVAEFFTRFGKTVDEKLTIDEVVACLESETRKPVEEKRHVAESGLDTPAIPSACPSLPGTPPRFTRSLSNLSITGLPSGDRELQIAAAGDLEENEEAFVLIGEEKEMYSPTPSPALEAENQLGGSSESIERVINIKECPLCRKPRMNSRAELDIITHLAICAANDPGSVNRIVVGSYVTASNAQRKYSTRILAKLTRGAYQLGANSANIIVQDRRTGVLLEEKMAVYVRLGMRLAYKGMGGAGGAMQGARIRRLLHSMSVKQGLKFDSINSVDEIKPFIQFHNLDMSEVLDPLSSFKTFNEFFYRKLKPDARPVTDPKDPNTLVSPADCRAMFFPTIKEATQFWIKGEKFSIAKLLGESFKEMYEGGSMCIFRLAPQDYHRFHSPVDGIVGKYSKIGAQYYTVNPQGVRSAIDIFGENVRVVQPITSPTFGETMHVWVGAMMVGSIVMSVKEGDEVKRGDEVGYFAFGGSTIIVLFPPGIVTFDADLVANSRRSMETLVRMGTRVGRKTGS